MQDSYWTFLFVIHQRAHLAKRVSVLIVEPVLDASHLVSTVKTL